MYMRIDKFLKVSRILKRRAVANDACSANKVSVMDRIVKPSYKLKVGDIVSIAFASGEVKFKVVSLNEKVNAKDASTLYEIIN